MCIGLKDCGIYWEAPAKNHKYEQENEVTKTESTNMTENVLLSLSLEGTNVKQS